MVTPANASSYAMAHVSEVIAAAKVSRPTFYEYFANKDEAFRVAIEVANAALLAKVRRAVAEEEPDRAVLACVRGLMEFTTDQPALARFLMNEPLGAGSTALDARDDGLAAIGRLIQARLRRARRTALAPDFSIRMILGGIYRTLGPRLRRAEPKIAALLPDLQRWLAAYEQPLASHQWRQLRPCAKPSPSPFVPVEPLRPPPPLPRGRLRLSDEEIAENQRRRIMFAAAELAQDKGYNATTMSDITKRAGVDGRAFYAMFSDKREAFVAVHEFGSQHVMEVTAEAFFSGKTWPDRNWEAGRAFTQFLEANPLVANVGFIEAYAVGPGAIQRVEDSRGAFGMLLQEGYRHVLSDQRPPRIVSEAIITTIFESVQPRPSRQDESALRPPATLHVPRVVTVPGCRSDQQVYCDEARERRDGLLASRERPSLSACGATTLAARGRWQVGWIGKLGAAVRRMRDRGARRARRRGGRLPGSLRAS
jgi:AcrR family transcriptional regulator